MSRVAGTRQPEPREGEAGPAGWRRGPQYRGSRVMPAEGRGLPPMDYGDKLPPSPQYIFTPPRRYIFTPPLTTLRMPVLWAVSRSIVQ